MSSRSGRPARRAVTPIVTPHPAPAPGAAAIRRESATSIWQDAFAAQGIDRSVLIASTFRSGSTYVASLLALNGLPGLGKERFAAAWRHVRPDPGEDFAAFLRGVIAEAGDGLFTAKLMWPHMAHLAAATGHGRSQAADLAALFAPARWIQVARADKFDQAISFWRAKSSGRWHVYAGEAEPALDYDFAGIRAALQEIELHDRLWDDFFRRAGIAPIRVIYEDLEADPGAGTAAMLAALGTASDKPVTAVSLKRQRDGLSATLRDRFLEDLYRA